MGTDKAGNLYILGEESGPKGHGETDISLLKLSPEGAILRQEYYGTSSFETAVALAVSPDGSTAIAGTLSTTIHFGGEAIYGTAFVAVFDADGKYLWGRGFQNPTGTVTFGGLLLDDDHGLIVGGGFDQTMTLAGESHAAVGTDDAFVARLDGTGKKLWIRYLGNAQSQAVTGLARKADGTIVAAGQFQGELSAGGRLIGPAQARDIFAMGIMP